MQIYKLTNKQKILAAAVLIATGCVSVLMAMRAPHLAVKEPYLLMAESASEAHHRPMMAKADAPTIQAAQLVKPAIPAVVAQAQAPIKSWEMANVKSATPAIPLSEKISEYTVVEVAQPTHFPAVGERVQLPMLNGQQVVAKVESATKNPNGDYTWSGHLEGNGTDYPVIMTYGERSIFATITTPEGSYSMESTDGLGWLYKNPAEIELSNPDAKDFLEIAEPH